MSSPPSSSLPHTPTSGHPANVRRLSHVHEDHHFSQSSIFSSLRSGSQSEDANVEDAGSLSSSPRDPSGISSRRSVHEVTEAVEAIRLDQPPVPKAIAKIVHEERGLGHRPLGTPAQSPRAFHNTAGIKRDQANEGYTLSADLKEIFAYNEQWATTQKQKNPMFFKSLAAQQTPKFLWIGCADSRVPANQLMGLAPGEVFVHRNVANVVIHTDLNCLSVLQYAVEVLKVEHVIVCGHYGCGGVKAAMRNQKLGLIDNWLRSIKDVYHNHYEELAQIDDWEQSADRLCELNVREQLGNVCQTSIVQDAWRRGQRLAVHGWMYDIRDGLLRDQDLCVTGADQLDTVYQFEN